MTLLAASSIRAARLDLVSLGIELLDAFIAGDRATARRLADFSFPEEFPGDRIDLLIFRRDQLRRDSSWLPWSLRALVLRDPQRLMVGFANFHGPPGVNSLGAPGAAEIGYTVFAAHRNKGYATETCAAMMDWAEREHGVRHFVSGIRPENAPSLRVIDKLGFTPTGAVVDEELIFELRR